MIIRIRDGLIWALAGLGVVLVAGVLSPTPTSADQPGEMCERYQSTPVDGGYVVSTNRWNSLGDLCLTTSGGTDFRVTRSTIDPANVEVAGRGPGAYPNIATPLDDDRFPISVDALAGATTSWAVTDGGGGGTYNAAYDIWYHPDRQGCPGVITDARSIELMIWLKHPNLEIPNDWTIAKDVQVGDRRYNIYGFTGPTGQAAVIYDMVTPVNEVTDLALGPITQDLINRGKIPGTGVLCQVSAGFELHAGAPEGLATTSFAFNPNGTQAPAPAPANAPCGASSAPTATPSAPAPATPTATVQPNGGGSPTASPGVRTT
ncbi:hypothetical protein LO762_26190 [Actinocorallia sp. API 0066]|uniref:GH12 family glycosyl hydrolase domain-containing protein n=1 Tax=Actinocorallia sp. API 0066 TaxID=2896846 RepID=UPI001E39B8A4|nr:hypothetical protein [Actinocorallia sp. API 0066]MCD0452646.1 hypothetical protein [Actinocorallia sp. API 0066]